MRSYVITVVMKGNQVPFSAHDNRANGRKSFFYVAEDLDMAVLLLEDELLNVRRVKDYWIQYIYSEPSKIIGNDN